MRGGALILLILVAMVGGCRGGSPRWKTIDVLIDEDEAESRPGHSTFRVESHVLDLLGGKPGGFFIELGAYDGFQSSNTLFLERRMGWRGLCIEAGRQHLASLGHRRCEVVSAVVASGETESVLYADPLNQELAGIWGDEEWQRGDAGNLIPRDGAKGLLTRLPVATLTGIFERHNVPEVIDFFSLDVEGAEHLVLRQFPFERYTCLIMCVERPNAEAVTTLRSHGYHPLKLLQGWGDVLYVHESLPRFEETFAKLRREASFRSSLQMRANTYRAAASQASRADQGAEPGGGDMRGECHVHLSALVFRDAASYRGGECIRLLANFLIGECVQNVSIVSHGSGGAGKALLEHVHSGALAGLSHVAVFDSTVMGQVGLGGVLRDAVWQLDGDAEALCLSSWQHTCLSAADAGEQMFVRMHHECGGAFLLTEKGLRVLQLRASSGAGGIEGGGIGGVLMGLERVYRCVPFSPVYVDAYCDTSGGADSAVDADLDGVIGSTESSGHRMAHPLCLGDAEFFKEMVLWCEAERQRADWSDAIVVELVVLQDVSEGWVIPENGHIIYTTMSRANIGEQGQLDVWEENVAWNSYKFPAGVWYNDTEKVVLTLDSTSTCFKQAFCFLELFLMDWEGNAIAVQRKTIFMEEAQT